MNSKTEPLSRQIEARIRAEGLVPKSERALNNLISTCDLLASQGIEISATTVGRITSEQYGGPKTQSIRNNQNLIAYIRARHSEQGRPKTKNRLRTETLRTGDNSIDAYIQSLEAELRQSRAENRSLRRAIPILGDYDLGAALDQGILTLAPPTETEIDPGVKEAVGALLDPSRLSLVGLTIVSTGQIISPDYLDAVFLTKSEVDALKSLACRPA